MRSWTPSGAPARPGGCKTASASRSPAPIATGWRRLNRMMVAVLARGTAWSAELFTITPNGLTRLLRGSKDPGTAHKLHQFLAQSWSIVECLCGEQAPHDQRAAFGSFLRDPRSKTHPEESFRLHFGVDFAPFLDGWKQWVLDQGIGTYEPPPDRIRDGLLDRVLPAIRDRKAKRGDRIVAIREWARHGFVLGADALIDLLRDPGDIPKEEIVWRWAWSRGWPGAMSRNAGKPGGMTCRPHGMSRRSPRCRHPTGCRASRSRRSTDSGPAPGSGTPLHPSVEERLAGGPSRRFPGRRSRCGRAGALAAGAKYGPCTAARAGANSVVRSTSASTGRPRDTRIRRPRGVRRPIPKGHGIDRHRTCRASRCSRLGVPPVPSFSGAASFFSSAVSSREGARARPREGSETRRARDRPCLASTAPGPARPGLPPRR